MAKYQKYAEYKDSGVEWLGEIPIHWFNTKVKYEAYVKARVGWHGLKSDDFTDEGPYLVTGSDFKGTNIDWSQCYHCDEPRYEQDPYIQLREGDLLITKDGTIGKVALVSNLKDGEKATLNSGIFVVRPLRNNFSTKFYFWLLQSKVFKEFVDFNKTGSTIVHLYQDTFVNFEYASPNLEDQLQIANFLDHETAKIDSLIEKQQQLIELLKEKRQAVISHAVTKGLNPNVSMKDSGVEWLGQVPEHWIITCLARISGIKRGSGYQNIEMDVAERETIQMLRIADMHEIAPALIVKNNEVIRYLVEEGDILVAGTGATAGISMLVPKECHGWVHSYNSIKVKVDPKKVNSSFLQLFLTSDYIKKSLDVSFVGSAQPFVDTNGLGRLRVLLPPLHEQIYIFDYLNIQTKKIDLLISKAQSQINFMQERRTALISAAVTGKIDVRKWQNPTEAKTEFGA